MPYRIDLFAVFIFLGIVQAIFLCFFFFSPENRKAQPNVFLGLMLLSMALCIIEIFLMYTGYIIDVLHLVDFSEPFSLVIGPFFYLFVVSMVRGRINRRYYWHFAFPVVFTILVIPYFIMPEDVKYNSWIESYKPGLPFRDYDYQGTDPRMFWFTSIHTELTIISLVLYAALALTEIVKAFRNRSEPFWNPANPVLRKLRTGILLVISTTALVLIVKLFNENDTGDHLLAVYISATIYLTSFGVMRQSGFFKPASLADPQKYKSSSLTPEVYRHTLTKLQTIMEKDKPFLDPDFSLPELAQRLNSSVHVLSQVINDGLGKTFFEMTAQYRVEEAKRLLKERRNIKVEEIAEQVGYNSKSSLNSAFKKLTGMTPSEFREK